MGLNVSEKTKANGPTKRQLGVTRHRAGPLALAALLMLVTAVLLDPGVLRMAMFFASGLLGVGSFIALIASLRLKAAQLRAVTMVHNLFESASDICFVSTDDGQILYANDAATEAGMGEKESLTHRRNKIHAHNEARYKHSPGIICVILYHLELVFE